MPAMRQKTTAKFFGVSAKAIKTELE